MASRNDVRAEIRQFLTTRRAKLTPTQAGLPAYGGRRRVPGLRREEVALLAGISIEYYTRLERGSTRGVSDEVLDGITRALQLDEVERAHLIDLVRTANAARPARGRATPQRVRPSVQRLLDSMTGTAAFLRNGRLDILAANQLGYALYAPAFGDPDRPVNLTRFIFLDARSTEFYRDWDGIAHAAVGSLRAQAGRNPSERALTELVGELSVRSPEFRVRWAAHDIDYYRSGTQPFHHPWSATSPSTTTRSSCRLTRDYRSSPTPPNPARPHGRHSTCWPAGPRRRTRHLPSPPNPTPEQGAAVPYAAAPATDS